MVIQRRNLGVEPGTTWNKDTKNYPVRGRSKTWQISSFFFNFEPCQYYSSTLPPRKSHHKCNGRGVNLKCTNPFLTFDNQNHLALNNMPALFVLISHRCLHSPLLRNEISARIKNLSKKKFSKEASRFKKKMRKITGYLQSSCSLFCPQQVVSSMGSCLLRLKQKAVVSSTGEDRFQNTQINHTHLSTYSILLSRTGLLDFSLLLLWSSLFLLAKTSRCDPPTTLRRFAWCDLLWSSPFSLPDDKSESVPQTRIITIYDVLNSTYFLNITMKPPFIPRVRQPMNLVVWMGDYALHQKNNSTIHSSNWSQKTQNIRGDNTTLQSAGKLIPQFIYICHWSK